MDGGTIAAYAAWAAALIALAGAGSQFFIGRKQADAALISAKAAHATALDAGRHTVAEFRQAWIFNVIDTLCELNAIIATTQDGSRSSEDEKKLASLRTRLEILLNPDESPNVALVAKIDAISGAANDEDKRQKANEAIQAARKILKTEWDRVKTELNPKTA